MAKPILAIDFDGVIHSYERGWANGEIYGHVVDGFWDWAREAQQYFTLVIHSARSGMAGGNRAMSDWLIREFPGEYPAEFPLLEFSYDKPRAMLFINDRAIAFNGDWYDRELAPEALRAFRPWNQRT
jgi:hypothetical protein